MNLRRLVGSIRLMSQRKPFVKIQQKSPIDTTIADLNLPQQIIKKPYIPAQTDKNRSIKVSSMPPEVTPGVEELKSDSWDIEQQSLSLRVGNFFLHQPMFNSLCENVEKVFYLPAETKIHTIWKLFKGESNHLLIFSPNIRFSQAKMLYESVSRKIFDFYFPMHTPATAKEIFNRPPEELGQMYVSNIEKLNKIKEFLNRIVIISSPEFEIRAKVDSPKVAEILSETFKNSESNKISNDDKLDQLIPFPMIMNAITDKSRAEKGFNLSFLAPKDGSKSSKSSDSSSSAWKNSTESTNDQLIVFKSVFAPTHKALYNFLFSSFSEKTGLISGGEKVLDVGVGTGVLSLLIKNALSIPQSASFYGVDLNPIAISNTKANFDIHGIDIKLQKFDITKLLSTEGEIQEENPKKNTKKVSEKSKTKSKSKSSKTLKSEESDSGLFSEVDEFDLIISNPPMLTLKSDMIKEIDSNESNIDKDGKFLTSLFVLAQKRLKKNSGKLFLVYSEVNQKFGFQENNKIENLVKEYGLKIKSVTKKEIPVEPFLRSMSDIEIVTKLSSICLYEIGW